MGAVLEVGTAVVLAPVGVACVVGVAVVVVVVVVDDGAALSMVKVNNCAGSETPFSASIVSL
jgi:hypothetical protein